MVTVVGGSLHERGRIDGGFLLFLALCLLPTVIYLAGIRSRAMVVIFGVCLFVPTMAAWSFYFLSDASMAGVPVIFAIPLTLLLSVIGTVIDRGLP
ncbi:MAG: hypothetical protein ACR2K0_04150 [Acidimicrobiales bacterium]